MKKMEKLTRRRVRRSECDYCLNICYYHLITRYNSRGTDLLHECVAVVALPVTHKVALKFAKVGDSCPIRTSPSSQHENGG